MSTTIRVPQDSRAPSNGHAKGAHFNALSASLENMTGAWLAGQWWRDSAPKSLSKNWNSLEPTEAWGRWAAYLAKRKPPIDLAQLCLGKANPLEWGLPARLADEPLAEEIAAWRKKIDQDLVTDSSRASVELESAIAALLDDWNEAAEISIGGALRAVIVAYRLPELAARLDADAWWRTALSLRQLAQSQQLVFDEDTTGPALLTGALVGGELPLVLSTQFPELGPFRELRLAARKCLGEGLLAATDGEGVVDAGTIAHLPTLFACWTRCQAIGETLKKNCWSKDAESQYEWLLRQTIRLMRVDGAPMLAAESYASWPAGAMDTALELAGDDGDHAAASAHLAKVLQTVDADFDEQDLPEPSMESEWSSLALLADNWGKKANRTLVDYSSSTLQIEIESQGQTLFSGAWAAETQFNGKTLLPQDDWEQQCWFSDEDCDFLDLVIELTGGARIERQILLGKEDGFLLLHDILHAPNDESGEWRHSMSLPFANSIEFAPEKETRDGLLVDAKGTPRAGVLPLALAEWRTDSRSGELRSEAGGLLLSQHAKGRRLSCPLWFDLRARRATRQRTWRQLTVAGSLEVVPRDVAAGYRVQSGDFQWLLYRSLAEPANRTLLGQNTAAEMLIGRFLRTGELDELLEVDPS